MVPILEVGERQKAGSILVLQGIFAMRKAILMMLLAIVNNSAAAGWEAVRAGIMRPIRTHERESTNQSNELLEHQTNGY